jgi:DNA glycosylase AlkZ-like
VTKARLALTREQILAHRRSVGALDERLPPGPDSLRRAAWAGLQDSMRRAALHSIHARVRGTDASALDDPSLVQVWGPRYSAYVVAERDRAVFTLGRLPDSQAGRQRANDMADRLDAFLAGRTLAYGEAGRGVGINPNALRYAAPTGRVLIHWDGARQPTVWTLPPPDVDPHDARLELARRHLHVLGPTTPAAFAAWAGIPTARGRSAFDDLAAELTAVDTPIGEAWILAADEAAYRQQARRPPAAARLLPSGDAYTLLQGADRGLLVTSEVHRRALWTPRVWPGAVLAGGEIVGTWRRANDLVTIEAWRRLSRGEREAIEAEAASLPLPGAGEALRVGPWTTRSG